LRALILTAGLGTRLHPLTLVRAKAAVPVNGEPIACRIIAWLGTQGLRDVVLNLHHRPDTIAAVVGDGSDLGARVRYSWENPVLGSAGGPRHALGLLVDAASADAGGSTFVVVNGDTLTGFPLAEMIDAHQMSGALVTMALIRNPRPDRYGGVTVEAGCVTGFTRRGVSRESFHFIGVQVAEARAFDALPDGVPAETVMQLYPQLISASPRAILAHVVEAPFRDVGTPADYLQTSLELAQAEGDHLVSPAVEVHRAAIVTRTAVWEDVRIGAGVHLDECIVCDDVEVPDGARYRRCAIVPYRGDGPRAHERVEGQLLISPF
jgi:NDP-sugar pyrophosphorylase family protein